MTSFYHLPYFFILSLSLLLIILPSIDKTVNALNPISSNNETDRLALLEFKSRITDDPFGVMTSWNNSIHFCSWYGVTCGRRHQRVTTLDLHSHNLVGSISPHIGNMSFLRNLTLENNSFTGQIPPELGRLHKLQVLHLPNNSLAGEIPTNLSNCLNLTHLHLANNQLSGKIPRDISSLINLRVLIFDRNNIMGDIPFSFGNLSSLQVLALTSNHLSGRIPPTLGQLKNLTLLALGDNGFYGTIPPSIFNLSSMESFGVGHNQLRGSLPRDLGIFFPNLQYFGIFNNQFTWSIPLSITNASNLKSLFLSENDFIGQVPNLRNLHELSSLTIGGNRLGSAGEGDLEFLSTLTNNTNFEVLIAGGNNFGGKLPDSIANLSSSTLKIFSLDYNQIVGSLPTGLANLRSLEILVLSSNKLSGEIPRDIGKLNRLQLLYLDHNDFTKNIPSSIGNLSNLIELDVSGNKLQGRIPSALGKCQNLLRLEIADNNLNGSIPSEVLTISSLSLVLNMSLNHLTGTLPGKIGNLKNLGSLDVSQNMLSGEIPGSLGDCESLERLAIGANNFRGNIPSSFASLRGLKYLNLSRNNVSGEVPNFLESLDLKVLDLSFNNFSGVLPSGGIFKNASATSVEGNDMLCAATLEFQLSMCTKGKPKKRLILEPGIIVAIVVSSLSTLVLLSLLVLWFSKRKNKGIVLAKSENTMLQVSYQSLFEATDGFSSTNLIGSGSFSFVYKGVLDLQRTVAIKVFNLHRRGASRSFMIECEALRKIKHRNLVKVITACSSIDFHGDDFKALVYEFMVNGNLDQWLHPISESTNEASRKLNLVQRLNIAIDVSYALTYLHHEHRQTPIVHCDLKPSNILLDGEMTAKVGDFGLAKFLQEEITYISTSSLGVRGTIGYAAPEYGMGSEVSTSGDMYSYGILLFEIFTGKRPTGDMFDNNMDLRNYVKMALPEQVAEITDPGLLEDDACRNEMINESLIAIFEIGIACSEEMPRERMDITAALAKLIAIRDNQQKVPRRHVQVP